MTETLVKIKKNFYFFKEFLHDTLISSSDSNKLALKLATVVRKARKFHCQVFIKHSKAEDRKSERNKI